MRNGPLKAPRPGEMLNFWKPSFSFMTNVFNNRKEICTNYCPSVRQCEGLIQAGLGLPYWSDYQEKQSRCWCQADSITVLCLGWRLGRGVRVWRGGQHWEELWGWNTQEFSFWLGYLAYELLPGRGTEKSREMRKNPKPENSHTCPQVCGWPVPVPWACAAALGFAGLSWFLMVDRDALFKWENNRNRNLYKKTWRPSRSLSKQ